MSNKSVNNRKTFWRVCSEDMDEELVDEETLEVLWSMRWSVDEQIEAEKTLAPITDEIILDEIQMRNITANKNLELPELEPMTTTTFDGIDDTQNLEPTQVYGIMVRKIHINNILIENLKKEQEYHLKIHI